MSKLYWVDSHCHLNKRDFGADVEHVITRAQESHVQLMVSISTDLNEMPELLTLVEQHKPLYCSVGIHPHEAALYPDLSISDLMVYADCPKVVGLGETGLDYYYNNSPKEIQKRALRVHIQAHKKTHLPLIIHSREGEEDLLTIFDEENVTSIEDGRSPGVIHCFSGTKTFALETLKRGFHISISGIITFKNAHELREIVKDLPLDRLLIETDAPFLAPVPYRGKRNEPAFVVETAKCISEIKGISLEEIQRSTTENFHTVFWKVPRLL